jgi:hypothetical protein
VGRLRDRQVKFARAIPRLIDAAFVLGYEVTIGDGYRDPRCSYGAKNSNHGKRLAIDLNLFKDGRYLTRTKDHQKLGEYWESIGGKWGIMKNGKRTDGNHYEWPK